MFNGVDVTFNVRGTGGFTFSGGTSTGKVVNDWCDIRAAVPENAGAGPNGYLINPYCHTESPWQTSFRSLVTYTIPRIDTQVSAVYQDKMNIGTDQIVSLAANYTLTPADQAAVAAQIGRPMTIPAPQTVNLLSPGELYGDRVRAARLRRQEDLPLRRPAVDRWRGLLQRAEQQRDARVHRTFVPEWPAGSRRLRT